MRIGIGYDIHRLVEDRKLFLGGVEIPYVKGLLGYSDGDVLLHAIADAMLGAMSLGDIGQHFPDTDPQYKGIRSKEDTIILAEEPKVYPFKEKMLDELALMLGIDRSNINVKATTNEGVGSIGKGDAIAAHAVVLLEKKGS